MDTTPAKSYSRPDQPVRHSYPLTVESEGLKTAFSIFTRTWPFMVLRLGVLLAFVFATVVWVALCAGIGALFAGKEGGSGGIIFFLFAVGLPFGVFAWLKHYILYLLKLGHVAAITELLVHGNLPAGMEQVSYGKKIITERFAQTNVLFAIDTLITGIARSFNRTLDWVSEFLPIPGMDSVMKLVHGIVHNATTFIDETIFSYNLARGDENVWRSSLDGIVYYAQNVKPVLKTAVLALVIEYAVTFVVFLLCLIPAWIIGMALPDSVASYAWVIALLFAAAIRSTVLRPLFLTMVAICFHVQSRGKAIDLDMANVLRTTSSKFEELSQKAASWTGAKPAPEKMAVTVS